MRCAICGGLGYMLMSRESGYREVNKNTRCTNCAGRGVIYEGVADALRAMRHERDALWTLCERAMPMVSELGCAVGCNETTPPMTCATCKWLNDYAALKPDTARGGEA